MNAGRVGSVWMVVAAGAVAGLLAGCDGMGFGRRPEKLQVDPARAYIDAKTALLRAADSTLALTRVHAMEALANTVGVEAGAIFLQGLEDANPAVRFASAMAIGDVRSKPALARLQKMAAADRTRGEPDKRVYAAVVYALYRLGDDSHAGDLAALLLDNEREVRMDAAMVMGKMGEPSAVGPLRAVLSNEQDEASKIQMLQALSELGDARSADILTAYTKGYFLDLRLAAIQALGGSSSSRGMLVLKDLIQSRNPARVRVAAAGQLARLGYVTQETYDLCLDALRQPGKVLKEAAKGSPRAPDTDASSLQQLAALALGWMNREASVNELVKLLDNPDGAVRVAAAMSILNLLKAYRPAAAPAAAPATAPAVEPAAQAPKVKPPGGLPELHTAGGKD